MKKLKIKFLEFIHEDMLKNRDGTHWLSNCVSAMGTENADFYKAMEGRCSANYLIRVVVTWCSLYHDNDKSRETFLGVWKKIGEEIFKLAHAIEDIDKWNARHKRK